MDPQILLPAADPMPLPAPYWLFKLLLLMTFILHIVAMNFLFGGGVIALFMRLFARGRENALLLANDLGKKLPAFVAAAVTLGVAPLLFLQVIYGQFFYTSSVIMAWPWFFVLPLLILAYYGFYLVAFKNKGASTRHTAILGVSVAFLFLVGFAYSNNMTLMLTPEKWAAKYFADMSGMNLNFGEPMLIPRFLHFMVAAVAVGGFLPVTIGLFRWNKEQDYSRYVIRTGGRWFMFATMVQFLVGIIFLVSLPREKMILFMGGNAAATVLLLAGIVVGIAVVIVMARALRREDPRAGAITAMSLTGLVLILMALIRDILRDAYLQPYFTPSSLRVATQWDVLALFLVLFIGGVVLWGWMMWRYFKAQAAAAS